MLSMSPAGCLASAATDNEGYPAVTLKDDSSHVSSTLGNISTEAPARVFEMPLKICVGNELQGRKLEICSSLHGSNLR